MKNIHQRCVDTVRQSIRAVDGSTVHVAIVEKVENRIAYIVEGNSDDNCHEKQRTTGYYEIYDHDALTY